MADRGLAARVRAVVVVDVVEAGKATGRVEDGSAHGLPLWGTREGDVWRLFAGTSDEFRSEAGDLKAAIRILAREAGVKGTAVYCYEYRNGRDHEIRV